MYYEWNYWKLDKKVVWLSGVITSRLAYSDICKFIRLLSYYFGDQWTSFLLNVQIYLIRS